MKATVCRMLQGISVLDLAKLAQDGVIYQNLYTVKFDGDMPYSVIPEPSDIPWYVALLYGGHSRKHVFETNQRVDMRGIRQDLFLFRQRLKWAWVFRKDGSDEILNVPLVKRPCSICDKQVDPSIETFARAMGQTVQLFVDKVNKNKRWRDRFRKPAYIAFATDWLKSNEMCAELSDKDGVFVILHREALNFLYRVQIDAPCYKQTSMLNVPGEFRLLKNSIRTLAKGLANLGYEKWSYEILRHVSESDDVSRHGLCRLSCTVKTHKPVGELSVRMIHGSSNHVLGSLGTALNRLVGEKLKAYKFLCSSSEELLAGLMMIPVSRSSLFLKLDVKEFYLSGAHDFLATQVSSLFKGPLAEWVSDAVLQ